MSMFKIFYSLKRNADLTARTAAQRTDDPFAHPQIASMDLRMLADLPPEQLRDGERKKTGERSRSVQDLALNRKICVS